MGQNGKKAKKKAEKKDKAENKKSHTKERTLRDLLFKRKEDSFVTDGDGQQQRQLTSKPQRSKSTDTPPVMVLPSMSPQASMSNQHSNSTGSQSSTIRGFASPPRLQHEH